MGKAEGFDYQVRKSGEIVIYHRGRQASTLRGEHAASFLDRVSEVSLDEEQDLLARVAGNYRRGNEREGKQRGK